MGSTLLGVSGASSTGLGGSRGVLDFLVRDFLFFAGGAGGSGVLLDAALLTLSTFALRLPCKLFFPFFFWPFSPPRFLPCFFLFGFPSVSRFGFLPRVCPWSWYLGSWTERSSPSKKPSSSGKRYFDVKPTARHLKFLERGSLAKAAALQEEFLGSSIFGLASPGCVS